MENCERIVCVYCLFNSEYESTNQSWLFDFHEEEKIINYYCSFGSTRYVYQLPNARFSSLNFSLLEYAVHAK